MAEFENIYAESNPFVRANFDCPHCGGKLWDSASAETVTPRRSDGWVTSAGLLAVGGAVVVRFVWRDDADVAFAPAEDADVSRAAVLDDVFHSAHGISNSAIPRG